VTDTSEGTGGDGMHRVDNVGRNNYVLFEFASPLIINQAFLGSVVDDSDISVWIGTFNNPYVNHLSLNDTVLNSFGLKQDNDTTLTTSRWAVFNGGNVVGNALVISASKSDTTPDDRFKINKLNVCK